MQLRDSSAKVNSQSTELATPAKQLGAIVNQFKL